MKIFKYTLRTITFMAIVLFICGADSIYDNNLTITWLLSIGFLSILTYKFAK